MIALQRHKRAIYLALLATVTVFIGVSIIYLVQSLLVRSLVGLLLLISLLTMFELNKLLTIKRKLKQKALTLDAVTDIYWQCNLKTGEFSYNERLVELLGYPEDINIDQDFWQDQTHPVDRPQQKYHLLKHLSDQSMPYFCEYRIRDHAGLYQWFAGRGKVVRNDRNGKPLYMFGRLDHIQERKDLEQSLIHAYKMDALGQLTGGIAHDFNNMLASILGYTELAIDLSQDATMQRYLDQIQQAGVRAKNVIKQLLDFSRYSVTETKIVSLQSEIHQTIQMLHSTFPSTLVITETFPSEDCFTRLDPDQLQRVLLNLCINARDAMGDKGHLSLHMETKNCQSDKCSSCHGNIKGNFHMLHIRDDGDGIDPIILDKLFEPFFTTKEFGKGTGMGLSVVHGVVHEYNGHISISSEVGKGTDICLYFPSLIPKTKTSSEDKNLEPTPVNINKKILIIEDDNFVSQFLFDLLVQHGCEVEIADSSVEAIQAITNSKDKYDVILSDQTMPGITGIELASRLYTLKPDLPIILYSGSRLDIEHCTGNVRMVLQKPIDNKALIEIIAKVSSNSQLVLTELFKIGV